MVLDAPGQIVSAFRRGTWPERPARRRRLHRNGRPAASAIWCAVMLAPDRVETCTAELLRADPGRRARSRLQDPPSHGPGAMEVETVRKLHGTTAPDWLASIGLLNDRLIAPHATNATEGDLELYAANGVSIVHCPLVSARGGSTLNSFSRCRERGINIAMGTDTDARRHDDEPAGRPDCLPHQRSRSGPRPLRRPIRRRDARRREGARPRRSRHGSHRARVPTSRCSDLMIAVMAPSIDPITTLVAGGSGKVTQAVFVDGRLSMRVGEVAGIDMTAARQRAQTAVRRPDRKISGAQLGPSADLRNLPAELSDRGQCQWLKPSKPVLEVRDLKVEFPGRHGAATALSDVSPGDPARRDPRASSASPAPASR